MIHEFGGKKKVPNQGFRKRITEKSNVAPINAMKECGGGADLHSFLISVQDGGETGSFGIDPRLAKYVQRSTESRSCNHCCSGKAMSIT